MILTHTGFIPTTSSLILVGIYYLRPSLLLHLPSSSSNIPSSTHHISTIALPGNSRDIFIPSAGYQSTMSSNSTPTLPLEVAANIMGRLPLRSCSPKHNTDGTVTGLTKYLENPLPMLKNLVSDPAKLLFLMTATGTILTGSRATAYFHPAAYDKDADWDFWCDGTRDDTAAEFFTLYTAKMGVEWAPLHAFPSNDIFKTARGTIVTNGVHHKVRLAWHPRYKAIQILLHFNMGIAQNFISGSAAVCLHAGLTLQGKMMPWAQGGRFPDQIRYFDGSWDEGDEDLVATERSQYTRQLETNGFELLPRVYDPVDEEEIREMKERRPILRCIGDEHGLVVNFAPYATGEGPIDRYMREREFENWHHVCWVQKRGKMMSERAQSSEDFDILPEYSRHGASRAYVEDWFAAFERKEEERTKQAICGGGAEREWGAIGSGEEGAWGGGVAGIGREGEEGGGGVVPEGGRGMGEGEGRGGRG